MKKIIAEIGLAALAGLVVVGAFRGCGNSKYECDVAINKANIVGEHKVYLTGQRLNITKISVRNMWDSWMIEEPNDSTNIVTFENYLNTIQNQHDRDIERAFLYKTADSLDVLLKTKIQK